MAGGLKQSTTQTGTRMLRTVLLGCALLLVAVVAGFIIVAHRKAHNWLTGLPRHLGVDIQQDSDTFTISQSLKGKKIYTLHASKEVQHSGGIVSLHDVGITLYGPTGEPTDRIHGADFEYDQNAQRMTAQGEVFIDLVPAATKDGPPLTSEQQEAKLVHVKTVGLVFDQKAQTARSDGAVEFHTGGYAGNAVGAEYNAKNGVVVLRSAVRMSGLRNERPVVVTATRAEMDRQTSVVDLQTAKYSSAGDNGTSSASAAHAIVHTAKDGTPQHVDAEGNVTLTGDRRGTVVSNKLALDLGPKGQARAAHLFGDVRYTNDEGGKNERGHAQDARIAFDDEGRPVHALMTGGVTFDEKGRASARNLEAATLDVALSGGGKQPTVVKNAQAFGPEGSRLRLVDDTVKGRSSTDVKADRLTGRFAAGGKATELTGLDGQGHSWVQRIASNTAGAVLTKDTSTGDVLHVDFKPGEKGRSELTRAEQRGRVATVHEAAQKQGPPQVEHGRADDVVYEAESDMVHMTGAVEVQDETSALFADRLDANRTSGDATANGAVRVTYVSSPAKASEQGASQSNGQNNGPDNPQEPVHVLATRAVAHKATGLAEFFGDAAGPSQGKARMWQGSSQVEAPELDFYRGNQGGGKRLIAHGDAGSDAAAVRVVLPGSDPAKGSDPKKKSGPVHVMSRQMVYTDSVRTVEFMGGVRLVDQDGTMTSKDATVWLANAAGPGARAPAPAATEAKQSSGFIGGRIDHMIATGAVELNQPGRQATGEKLVYTASDGVFVLTGTKAAPPQVVDETQGTTTGAALRFKSGDDSVEVLGGDGKTAGRVRSTTRTRQ